MKKSRYYYEGLIEGLTGLYMNPARKWGVKYHKEALETVNALMSEYSYYYNL